MVLDLERAIGGGGGGGGAATGGAGAGGGGAGRCRLGFGFGFGTGSEWRSGVRVEGFGRITGGGGGFCSFGG